ncbi:DUF2397 family protein [Streptomyces niveiscabiei]|uniref:DUF2397 family protein n=1 Tax=Streptomyces niveiscabiei TaxID=164115 RepID=UPI0029ACCCDE|nr:DUF2397 family protein [Streptomyces niveiscabiei]MDX3387202.1 DUF2397 family protein [Streptomyces niveiscabiei]
MRSRQPLPAKSRHAVRSAAAVVTVIAVPLLVSRLLYLDARRSRSPGGVPDRARRGAVRPWGDRGPTAVSRDDRTNGCHLERGTGLAHLTAPDAALHRRVMRVFHAAKKRFAVHLRPEDVHAALEPEHRPADQDTSRATAVGDFCRKRFIYQPTRAGEATEQALSVYDEALGRRGALQAVALHDIVTRLRALLVLTGEPNPAEAHLALSALTGLVPRLASWADRLRGDGLVRRLARTPSTAKTLLTGAAAALRALPADPAVSLAAFAAGTLGDAHALDDGTPLATLVLSGVRALTGFPDGTGAEWRREAWASAGLLRDALSSTVLTVGLRGTPALDWLTDTGEPAVLTLRQLTRTPPRTAPAIVHVCENPAVLATAADTLAPPLTGTPTTAPWDPALAPALTELGLRIDEETVLDVLLADLTP